MEIDMVRHRRASLAILLPLLLSACGGGWTHSARSSNDFAQDDASCRQQAIEKVQSSHQKQEAPKWMTRAFGTTSYWVDGNDATRERWHKSCLRMLGWAPDVTASLASAASSELARSGLSSGLQYLIH
jgi:hypothetical protein